jgi:hypothetical protein
VYEHTQRSPQLLLLFCLAGGGTLVSLSLPVTRALPLGARLTLGAAAVAMIGSGLLFSSLTIRVADGRLDWHFGPGVMRRSVPLGEIASAEPATTSWADGWGVHLTRRGWLYNEAGHQAVLVTKRDGTRFMLGTDEPAGLVRELGQ